MLHSLLHCEDWGIDSMDKLKLQWKIFAFLFGFSFILLIVLWLFQTVFLYDMYKLVRKAEIEKAINLVEKNIDSPDLQNILYELDEVKEIRVTPTGVLHPQGQGANRRDGGKGKIEIISEKRIFTRQDGSDVALNFNAIITPVDATVSTLKMQLYVVTGIMVALSIVLALIMARRVSKPIVEINKSAKELALGHYDTKFAGHGFLEITELSDTLNTTAYELSKVESLRRELMANISHDLRTPLTLIYSYAEMMHDFPSEITSEQTQMIMDETMRLTSLVNDVLDVSRLETGTVELNLQPYNITQSICATVSRISKLVKKDGYSVFFEHNEDLVVSADEIKITQAFYNLLLNAITHSGNDKLVIVRQIVVDGWVRIEVIDNGEGVSCKDMPYIWDRYYKVDKRHKRAVTGTGLGLSIVKKIMELHGGSYGVESEQGKGSTFWFMIKSL
ncbi:MAG: HAMP domain-containing sensor histidine kinase [Filifactoraceae bacterium]